MAFSSNQKRWAERGGIAAAALGLGYVIFRRRGDHASHQLHGHKHHEDQ
jgi:hypothetical protein